MLLTKYEVSQDGVGISGLSQIPTDRSWLSFHVAGKGHFWREVRSRKNETEQHKICMLILQTSGAFG